MNYIIKPFLLDLDNKYGVLFDEIMSMSLTQLDEIIIGLEAVFNGKWSANSFSGHHMSIVNYDKRVAKIGYFDELIGEEPTIEIYNMLKAYRDKRREYENLPPAS